MWRYFNKYVYLKLFIPVPFPKNKIIKISPRKVRFPLCQNSIYAIKYLVQILVCPRNFKNFKKIFLIDAHYKTWAVFSDHTRIFCSLLRV